MANDDERTSPRDAPRANRYGFKRAFLRGLGVLLPSVLTLWILVAAYQFVDRNIAEPINGLARAALAWGSTVPGPLKGRFEPDASEVEALVLERSSRTRVVNPQVIEAQLRADRVEEWWRERWWTSLFGILVALSAVYIAGRLVGGWLGRRAVTVLENALTRLPVLKQVYPAVKQIVGFFFADAAERKFQFSRVVVVEYPRKGIWSIGLVTGESMRGIQARAGEALTVFVPSSPTPFTGYTINVPRGEIHELPISIDEALKFVVSGGVVVPPHQEAIPRAQRPLAERLPAETA